MSSFKQFLLKLKKIFKVILLFFRSVFRVSKRRIIALKNRIKRLNSFSKAVLVTSCIFVLMLLVVLITVGSQELTNRQRKVRVPVQVIENEEVTQVSEEPVELREREDYVYTLLLNEGFTKEAVCGIMGNISVECTNYNPKVTNVDDVTYGLFQWNEVGERKTKMLEWCKENEYSHDSIRGQVAYAIYEIKGGDAIACRLDGFLRNTHDAYTAAQEFAAGFERCVSSSSKDAKYTGSIYPEYYGNHYQSMFMRISRSLNYYTRYVERGEEPQALSNEDDDNSEGDDVKAEEATPTPELLPEWGD